MNRSVSDLTYKRFVLVAAGWLALSLGGCGQEQATSDQGAPGPVAAREQAAATQTTPAAVQTPTASSNKGLILVTGITGQQGGAAAAELAQRGYPLRGLTRDTGKQEAQTLAARGIEMVQGDFSDVAALQASIAGVYGIFLNTPNGPDEVAQGKTVINTAKAAGVNHIVYSTHQPRTCGYHQPGDRHARCLRAGKLGSMGCPHTGLSG